MPTQRAEVLFNGKRVGELARKGGAYFFRYDDEYVASQAPPISLSLPKTRQLYVASYLFPFFSGLLAEGTNKSMQVRLLRLDDRDEFTRLLETAHTQTIGAVTVRELPADD